MKMNEKVACNGCHAVKVLLAVKFCIACLFIVAQHVYCRRHGFVSTPLVLKYVSLMHAIKSAPT